MDELTVLNGLKQLTLSAQEKEAIQTSLIKCMKEASHDTIDVMEEKKHEEKRHVAVFKKTLTFFDKLEDKVRERLSHRPILYTFIGGVAIVLFWRGVWMTADLFPFLTGPISIAISVAVLMLTGLFASFFVGDVILMSGLKKEKKLIEKTESEIKDEGQVLSEIQGELHKLEHVIEEHIEEHNEERRELSGQ
jgi:hypothetical protein